MVNEPAQRVRSRPAVDKSPFEAPVGVRLQMGLLRSSAVTEQKLAPLWHNLGSLGPHCQFLPPERWKRAHIRVPVLLRLAHPRMLARAVLYLVRTAALARPGIYCCV